MTFLLVFAGRFPYSDVVIRERGAPSIAMGITPHEMYDEMCRAAHPGRAA
jgi:hypothetical protein